MFASIPICCKNQMMVAIALKGKCKIVTKNYKLKIIKGY